MKPTKQELAVINSRLPGTTLDENSVEVLPFKLFDSNITDRYTVMSVEMMRKLVQDANDGLIAFNTMHQSRYTLPVGRSITGKIEKDGDTDNLLVKMYAVTQRPDGTPLEDGKDVADRYNTGAVYACSAGVMVGLYKCSICGNDIRDWENCSHWPGETYKINEEQTELCTALMTGKDIRNGVAMDCGCYECSAVTAGGVRKASVLTETFGKYDKSADVKGFKRLQFENKEISDVVTLIPATYTTHTPTVKEEENNMDANVKELMDRNYGLIEAKSKAELGLAQLTGQYDVLKNQHDALTAKVAEFEALNKTLKTDFDALSVEHAAGLAKVAELESTLTAKEDEFTQKLSEAKAAADTNEAFRTVYIALVEANGVKLGREADYASKSLEELQALNDEYLAAIAEIPAGRQSDVGGNDEPVVSDVYECLPSELFKTL